MAGTGDRYCVRRVFKRTVRRVPVVAGATGAAGEGGGAYGGQEDEVRARGGDRHPAIFGV